MRKRKIVLIQRTDDLQFVSKTPYQVHELCDTIDYAIGQKLTRAEVEGLLREPRTTVVIKG